MWLGRCSLRTQFRHRLCPHVSRSGFVDASAGVTEEGHTGGRSHIFSFSRSREALTRVDILTCTLKQPSSPNMKTELEKRLMISFPDFLREHFRSPNVKRLLHSREKYENLSPGQALTHTPQPVEHIPCSLVQNASLTQKTSTGIGRPPGKP